MSAQQQQFEEGREWSNGLCGCFKDAKLCIITYLAPCYTAGKNAEAIGEGCVYYGFCSLVPIANIVCGADIREKVRTKFGIRGTTCDDMMAMALCPFCALVQSALELRNNQVEDQAMDRY